MKKRLTTVIVLTALCFALAFAIHMLLSGGSSESDYSEVLDQYRVAGQLSIQEYTDTKSDYPMVSENAMKRFADGSEIYYAYCDLNGDNNDELLIASYIENYDEYFGIEDILVCNDGKVSSVMEGLINPENEFVDVLPAYILENHMIVIDAVTDPRSEFEFDESTPEIEWSKKESWSFRLNRQGTELIVQKHLMAENKIWYQKYYNENKEISWDSYSRLMSSIRDSDFNIPYRILISHER